MKKKIFITGAVREYDSANPQPFCDGIRDYIMQNMLDPKKRVPFNITAYESAPKEVTVFFPLSTGDDISNGCINQELYRLLTGEYKGFRPEDSIYWRYNFGSSFLAVYYVHPEDVVASHKKNTRFYHANRFKDMSVEETAQGLKVKFQF